MYEVWFDHRLFNIIEAFNNDDMKDCFYKKMENLVNKSYAMEHSRNVKSGWIENGVELAGYAIPFYDGWEMEYVVHEDRCEVSIIRINSVNKKDR